MERNQQSVNGVSLPPQEQLVYQALAACNDPRAEALAARARFIAERREAGDQVHLVSTAPWRDR